MAELIFRYTEDEGTSEIREAKEVKLSVPNDMNIDEFKVVCVRLAQSLGYQEKSIETIVYTSGPPVENRGRGGVNPSRRD